MTDLDIPALRAIAEAATEGPWRAYESQTHAEMFVVDPRGFLMDGIVCGPTYEKRNVEHVATFDPPTVIELLDRLERAERERGEAARLSHHYRNEYDRAKKLATFVKNAGLDSGYGRLGADEVRELNIILDALEGGSE